MTAASGSTFIAWWGAGLSTLLAFVRLFELWRDRFRIEIGYSFNGDSETGNEIYIRNLTNKSLILVDWELLYCSGRIPFREFSELTRADEGFGDQTIPPHSSRSLWFSGPEHFDWGVDTLKGRSLYIRFQFAGYKMKLRKVYRPAT